MHGVADHANGSVYGVHGVVFLVLVVVYRVHVTPASVCCVAIPCLFPGRKIIAGDSKCSVHKLRADAMEWLRLVGSLKLYVSFAECRLFYRSLLQKRPIIVRNLLIVATS